MKTTLDLRNPLAYWRRVHTLMVAPVLLLATSAIAAAPAGKSFSCRLNQRLTEAAARYRHSPPPRAVFHDIAFPANPPEYKALKKSAVLLVTVLTQNAGELPLGRLYAVVRGAEIPLPLVAERLSCLAPGPAARVFGRFREDAFYLVPTEVVLAGATISVDFATHRSDFPIARFSSADVPPFIRNDPKPIAGEGSKFSSRALINLIEREYPGFRFTKISAQAYSLSISPCRAR